MSIEHGKGENDLEQYGVWVKKTPEEGSVEEVQEQKTESSALFIDDFDFADISETDTVSDSLDADLNEKIDEALESAEDKQVEDKESGFEESPEVKDQSENSDALPAEDVFKTDNFDNFTADEGSTGKEIQDPDEAVDIDIEEYMGHSDADSQTSIVDEQPLDMDLSFENDNLEKLTPDFPQKNEESIDKTVETSNSVGDNGIEEIDADIFNTDNIDDISDTVTGIGKEHTEEKSTDSPDSVRDSPEAVEIEAFEEPENVQTVQDESLSIETVDISAFDTGSNENEKVDGSSAENEGETRIYEMTVKADDESDNAADEIVDKDGEDAKTAEVSAMSSSLLEKIMGELSLLRQDIDELKSGLDSLKNSPPGSGVKKDKSEGKAGGGFFAEDEGDDTIALSGDELNSILTSADFTAEEEAEETPDTQAVQTEAAEKHLKEEIEPPTVDGSELHEQETVAENIDFDINESAEEQPPEQLPSEIEIPIVEDLVVDSSVDDFFAEDNTPKEIDETTVQFLSEKPEQENDGGTEVNFDLPVDEEESEEEVEDLNQYSPVNDVFNSEQWETEEKPENYTEADGEAEEILIESEKELEESLDEPKEGNIETVFGKNIQAPGTSMDKPLNIPVNMRDEIKSVLSYMDQLLENLPEEKIVEFAKSEHFPVYKKLFNELGLS